MIRLRSMLFFPRVSKFSFVQSVEHHFIDDADDRGVHRAVLALGGVARGTAGYDQDGFAESGIPGIDCDQVSGFIVALRRDRFHDEQLLAFQARILARRNHGADNASENHRVFVNLKTKIPVKTLSASDGSNQASPMKSSSAIRCGAAIKLKFSG